MNPNLNPNSGCSTTATSSSFLAAMPIHPINVSLVFLEGCSRVGFNHADCVVLAGLFKRFVLDRLGLGWLPGKPRKWLVQGVIRTEILQTQCARAVVGSTKQVP